ncbi:MAG: recombinase family protein [Vulcanimicrobiaceae bacterium]
MNELRDENIRLKRLVADLTLDEMMLQRRNDLIRSICKKAVQEISLEAVLLIAKLDRLARNVAFIANLMESGVEFRTCDVPEANRLLLHIMAAVAEAEARAISDRTRVALKAAKERGSLLGAANPSSRNLTPEAMVRGRQRGTVATKEWAREAYAEIVPLVRSMRDDDDLTLAEIADELTKAGYRTRTGKKWNAVQVKRILDRAEAN